MESQGVLWFGVFGEIGILAVLARISDKVGFISTLPPVSHNRYRFLDFRRIWTLSSQTGRGICRVGLPSHRRRRLGRESEGAAGKYGLHDETTNDFLRQGEEEYTAFRSSLLRTNGRIQRHPPRCEMNGVPIFPSTSTATRTISEPPTVPAHAEPRY